MSSSSHHNKSTTSNNDDTAVAKSPTATTTPSRRRSRPPLTYTHDFATPSKVTLSVIGVVRSPYKERFGTPRQPVVTCNTLGNCAQRAVLQLDAADSRFSEALSGLQGFDYCWILAYMHLNQAWKSTVRPPRGPRQQFGVFATRSPHHPNNIALSCLKIEAVDVHNARVTVRGIDLLDGTPILDIKPYVPYCDAFPNARAGWLSELSDPVEPDALSYSPAPAHLFAREGIDVREHLVPKEP